MAATCCKPCSVTGLYSLVDIQKLCSLQNFKLSEEAEDDILYTILKLIGPRLASKAVHKLMDTGYLAKESNRYEVEEILDKCFCHDRNCDVYLIKWRHWPSKFNTWEPASNLGECEKVLEAYDNSSESKLIFPLKRKHMEDEDDADSSDDDDDYVNDQQRQINDIFSKLKNGDNKISSITLVTLSGLADDKRLKMKQQKVLNPCLRKPVPAWATKKRTKVYQEHKASLRETLLAWETKYNAVYSKCKPIVVENCVDLEAPPENFKFICDYLPMDGLVISSEPVMGCACEVRCCAKQKKCCPHNSDASFAYTSTKKVRLMPGSAIYECNSRCTCDSTCWNRVVQHGSQVKLAIFKTKNGCGWGVKAKQKIKRGTFVMEYLGEIITQAEAENRGKVYDSELFTYLFDLDFDGDDCQFTIDARNYGNIAHFVNHSCDPNMSVYGVWINNLDVRLPRIALFANRDIKKGEELSFDYKMTGDTSEDPNNMSVRSEKTPAKMSPFKHSPLRSPLFRKPSLLTSTTTVVGKKMSFDDFQIPATDVTGQPPATDVTVQPASSDTKTDGSDIKSSPLEDCMESDIAVVESVVALETDETTMVKTKQVEGEPFKGTLESDMSKVLPDLLDGSASSATGITLSALDTSSTASTSSTSISTDLSVKSPSKPDFSCKNYRIVCHCGAKNCRKFLF